MDILIHQKLSCLNHKQAHDTSKSRIWRCYLQFLSASKQHLCLLCCLLCIQRRFIRNIRSTIVVVQRFGDVRSTRVFVCMLHNFFHFLLPQFTPHFNFVSLTLCIRKYKDSGVNECLPLCISFPLMGIWSPEPLKKLRYGSSKVSSGQMSSPILE